MVPDLLQNRGAPFEALLHRRLPPLGSLKGVGIQCKKGQEEAQQHTGLRRQFGTV
jgi:hypothetical protein